MRSKYKFKKWTKIDPVMTKFENIFRKNRLDLIIYRNYNITVNKSFVSKMIGQHRTNIEILRNMGYNCKVYSGEVLKYSLKICEDV